MSESNAQDAEADPQTENKGRDARGRWRKGHCPNPKGRPRKKRADTYDPSDVLHFGSMQIELMVNGQPVKLDRRSALLNKIFESAMKGRVTRQRFLMGMFDKKDAGLAELRQQYRMLMSEWVTVNPDYKDFHESFTLAQRETLLSMGATLNHYYSGQFEAFLDGGGALEDSAGSEEW